jgi:hypothetical protein
MIKEIYYKIFVSIITTIKNSKNGSDIWQFASLFLVSVAMFLNVFSIWLIIDSYVYSGFASSLYFEIIPNSPYNGIVIFSILIFIPIVIINYFLIYYKNNYLKLLERFPDAARKKFISGIYLAISWFGTLFLFLIVMINHEGT